MRKPILFSTAVMILTAAMVYAADPVTPPARKKAPVPSDWVKQESKTYHFTFSVPKQWTASGSDGSDTFDLTPPKLKEKGKNLGTLQITASQNQNVSLDAKLIDMRENLTKESTGAKIVKDEATTMGDHPAWQIITEITQKSQQTLPGISSGAPSVTHEVIKRTRTFYAVAIEGNYCYQAQFNAEGSAFSGGLYTVSRVLDSFAIEPSATPTPAAASGATPSPAAEVQIPKDAIAIESKTFHYRFYVPKTWTKYLQKDNQATYYLPQKSKDFAPGIFTLISGKYPAVGTLDMAAAGVRKLLTAKGPAMKITDDKATELAGKPAWLFSTETAATKQVNHASQTYHVISVENGNIYDLSLDEEGGDFDTDLASFKQLIGTFSWLDG